MKTLINTVTFTLVLVGLFGCFKKSSDDDAKKEIIIIPGEDSKEVSYLFDKISSYENRSFTILKGEMSHDDMSMHIYRDSKCGDLSFVGVAIKDNLSDGIEINLISNEKQYISYKIYLNDELIVDCTTLAVIYQDSIAPNAPESTLANPDEVLDIDNSYIFPYFLKTSAISDDIKRVKFYDDNNLIKEVDMSTILANQGYINIQANANTSIYASFVDRAGNESPLSKIASLLYTDLAPAIVDLSALREQFLGVKESVNYNFKVEMESSSDILYYDLNQGEGEKTIDYQNLKDNGIAINFNTPGSYSLSFKIKRGNKYSEVETITAYIGVPDVDFNLTPNVITLTESVEKDKGISFEIQNKSLDINYGIGTSVTPTMTDISAGINYINHEFDCLRELAFESVCYMELSVNHEIAGQYTDTFTLSFDGKDILFTIQYDLVLELPPEEEAP